MTAHETLDCPCGFGKDLVYGVAICTQHCDRACHVKGCPRCARYAIATRTRTDAEYAAEKRG